MKKRKVGKKKKLPKVRKVSRIYEQRYLYALGVILLISLFVVGVKIVSSFAYMAGNEFGGSVVKTVAKPKPTPTKAPAKSLIRSIIKKYTPPKPATKTAIKKTSTLDCTNLSQFEARATKQNIVDALHAQFNMSLQGNQESGKDQAWQIYTTMCLLNNYHSMSTYRSRFLQLAMIPAKHINIQLNVGYGCIEGSSYYANEGLLEIGWCRANEGEKAVVANRFTLVHELGHFIHYRQDAFGGAAGKALFANFVKSVYGSSRPDVKNYYTNPNRLPTTNCWFATQYDYGPWMESECYSDMIGEYVVYNSYFQGTVYSVGGTARCGALLTQCGKNGKQNFLEYPTEYAKWYNYAKNYIFGGVEICNQACRQKPACPPADACLSVQSCRSNRGTQLPKYYCGNNTVCCSN